MLSGFERCLEVTPALDCWRLSATIPFCENFCPDQTAPQRPNSWNFVPSLVSDARTLKRELTEVQGDSVSMMPRYTPTGNAGFA